MLIFAIDPGSKQSGYTIWSPESGFFDFGKVPNEKVVSLLKSPNLQVADVVIEKITLYQRADENIHDTVLWCGRYVQVCKDNAVTPVLAPRSDVKKILLPGLKPSDRNDSTVKAYLKDRFAPGVSNHGKGTKSDPGYFYGFKADVWQAFALAVAYHDSLVEAVAA
ncbi:hypothetical protein D0962_18875 [Leptolyngbyaceae cyanobacterium CCMR0082]|uniref:Uncharacterized protein n=1 Tax=Adonisia turfae CCMR0082 TaxID=2304604 RepID=A0A6M0S8M2_9CYAN|nr:hypothetical protein [Adonisia turfae]NEZ64825.1 hypothetical protein [Adonisia turfae CCMR0082]